MGREADIQKCVQKRVHAPVCVHTDIPSLWVLGAWGTPGSEGLA